MVYPICLHRDLMKWCNRIESGLAMVSVKDDSWPIKIFRDALDCFCMCHPNMETRLKLALAVAAKLGILKTLVGNTFLMSRIW